MVAARVLDWASPRWSLGQKRGVSPRGSRGLWSLPTVFERGGGSSSGLEAPDGRGLLGSEAADPWWRELAGDARGR